MPYYSQSPVPLPSYMAHNASYCCESPSCRTPPSPASTWSEPALTPMLFGTPDRILAERFKTKMCRNYVTMGMCPYEQRCMFAHGDDDLRTTESNLEAGLHNEEAIRLFQRDRESARLKARAEYAAKRIAELAAEAKRALNIETPRTYRHDPYAQRSGWVPIGPYCRCTGCTQALLLNNSTNNIITACAGTPAAANSRRRCG